MQISYNATRVKIWNLFLFSKNFNAKNFEVKNIRSGATRAEMFREPIFENLARGFSTSKILLEPEVRHGRSAEIVRFEIPHPLTVNITVHFLRLTVKNNLL